MPENLENQQSPQVWKSSVFIPIPKKGKAKECSNYHTNHTHLICWQSSAQNSPSQVSPVHEPRTSRCSAGFIKCRGTRDQIANILWIIEKARDSIKTSTSASLTMLKSLMVWFTTNCGKFFKRWEYQTT